MIIFATGNQQDIEMVYYRRKVDEELLAWKSSDRRMPLLLRGARQVGKSTAVRQLGKTFKYYVEVNLERQPSVGKLFTDDIDVKRTCGALSAMTGVPIVAGETLLFIDEIQVSKAAVMSLRYFKEEYGELHVIAAGSLLEFTLEELPSFGVGRIRSMYMYPFSFDEFVEAQGLRELVEYKRKASADEPLPEAMHQQLTDLLKTFYLIGGMPAAVREWIETGSYLECGRVHNDILETYQDDFSKYKKRVSPTLLRKVLRSVALQAGQKFTFSRVDSDTHTGTIKEALRLLTLAGLIVPVTHTDANGVPLGAEEDDRYVKYLFVDLGLMQTMLNTPASDVLLASDVDFVNRGAASEMFAGLEMMKYGDSFRRAEMHYWQSMSRNGNAEVDYLTCRGGVVVPVEVKANTRGSMQSLWLFMRKKNLTRAIRTSLENYGRLEYIDKENGGAVRMVDIVPLYGLSTLL